MTADSTFGRRLGFALGLSMVSGGCAADQPKHADTDAASEAESTTISVVDPTTESTATRGGSASTTDGGSDGSDTGWDWELPEGCASGIPERGKFCFKPVPLPTLAQEDGGYWKVWGAVGIDLDDSGTDALVLYKAGDVWVLELDEDEETFEIVQMLPTQNPVVGHSAMTVRFDVDGDGFLDLLAGRGIWDYSVVVYRNLGGTLAPPDDIVLIDPSATALPSGHIVALGGAPGVPPDFVVASHDHWGEHPGVINGGRVLQSDGQQGWSPAGDWFDLPACRTPGVHAYGDFDGDGWLDAIVVSHWNCEPLIEDYDPAWHRAVVYLADPAGGVRERYEIPTGAAPHGIGAWAGDFDDDGHVDVVYGTYRPFGMGFLRGNGDGTFEDAVVFSHVPANLMYPPRPRLAGDFDGDGVPDLLTVGLDEASVLLSLRDAPAFAAAQAFLPGTNTLTIYGTAELNGDGVRDIVLENPENWREVVVLLSKP